MQSLVSASNLCKSFGSKELFKNLSLGVFPKEKVGMIGPNGSGKSTFLKILSKSENADSGEISWQRGLRVAYLAQEVDYQEGETVYQYAKRKLLDFGVSEDEVDVQAAVGLGTLGFEDFEQKVEPLSGGWRKKLQLSTGVASEPDILILDEPTNHLDWDTILWLESWLKSYKSAFLVVTHDREFLESTCNRIIEINRMYEGGFLSQNLGYSEFLEKKREYIQKLASEKDRLANRVRREVSWLRAGVKARTTKSRSRIEQAHGFIDQLEELKGRQSAGSAKTKIKIEETERKGKKLIELKEVTIGYPDKELVSDLSLTLGTNSCLGLLGHNGSGKTSLLRSLMGDLSPLSGEVDRADGLKIVYLEQQRAELPMESSLIEFLGDGTEYVLFNGQSVHVAAYASRFLFESEKMQLKLEMLSGGERARLHLAKALLQPADIVILDEPTNDLDIETIEVLEQNLSEFKGLLILVSHDRRFLSQLSDRFLALNNDSSWEIHADIEHWLRGKSRSEKVSAPVEKKEKSPDKPQKKKLSYKDKQKLKTIEEDIASLEAEVSDIENRIADPEVASDHVALSEWTEKLETKKAEIDALFEFWQENE